MNIEKERFGMTADGVPVDRYTLQNRNGMMVRLITLGATVTELWTRDRNGELADVALGYDELTSYERQDCFFGATVGRVAFRIADGQFSLDGQRYQLTLDDKGQHLHGGPRGFSRAVWQAEPLTTDSGAAVRLTHRSPDGDQGYPGAMDVTVVYTLTEQNELRIDYKASTDRPTLVNLTHHTYFNLAGHGRGDVLGHVLQLDADRWIPDEGPNVPSDAVADATATPYDFRQPTPIGERIEQTDANVKGYDLCYLLNHDDGSLVRAATLAEPISGRTINVLTTEPSIVFYTANHLDGTRPGKGGAVYPQFSGVCLETGRPPNAINCPHFPSTVLRPGQVYRHTCVYRFSTS